MRPGALDPSALRRAAPWAALVLLLLAAAVAGGELAGGAVRATALVLLLGGALLAVSRRGGTSAPAALSLLERRPLAKESGVALVVVAGRRLVVGYAPGAVTLLTELAAPAGEVRP